MHGTATPSVSDTFNAAGVGQTIAVKPGATGLFPVLRDCISNFTATSVTGTSVVLSYDVQVNGVWTDSGIPPVSVPANGAGTLFGTANSSTITAVRHRVTNMTGGTLTVTNRLVDIHGG